MARKVTMKMTLYPQKGSLDCLYILLPCAMQRTAVPRPIAALARIVAKVRIMSVTGIKGARKGKKYSRVIQTPSMLRMKSGMVIL